MSDIMDKELKTLMRGQAVDAGPFVWSSNACRGTATKNAHRNLGLEADNFALVPVLTLAQNLLTAYGYKQDLLASTNTVQTLDLAYTVTTPDAMVVEGAGTDELQDKVVLRAGSYEGYPFYSESGAIAQATVNEVFIANEADIWFISFEGSVPDATYPQHNIVASYRSFDNDPSFTTPDLVSIWEKTANGELPLPTVRRATWADIDAAGIDRGTIPIFGSSELVFDASSYIASALGSAKTDTQLIQLMLERGTLETFNNAKNDRERLAAVFATLSR